MFPKVAVHPLLANHYVDSGPLLVGSPHMKVRPRNARGRASVENVARARDVALVHVFHAWEAATSSGTTADAAGSPRNGGRARQDGRCRLG